MSDPAVRLKIAGQGASSLDRRRPMRVLIVEDDVDMLRLIETVVQVRGHQASRCADAESAWAAYQQGEYALAFLDWQLPGMDGLELCRKIRTHPNGDRTIILMITARDGAEDLQAVLRAGANDYIAKPVTPDMLTVRLAIAEQSVRNLNRRHEAEEALRDQEQTVLDLKRQLNEKTQFQGLIGKSRLMGQLYEQIRDLAKVDTTVLIEGQTGTGKELVARAIHLSSPRKAGPFIAVNCAGLTDALLGSQLFGHKKGALRGRSIINKVSLKRPMAGHYSSMKSGIFLQRCRPIYSVSCKREKLSGSVSHGREKSTCGYSAATHHNLSQDVVKECFAPIFCTGLSRSHSASVAARSSRGHSLTGRLFPRSMLRGDRQTGRSGESGSDAGVNELCLAGQCSELKSAIESGVISCKETTIRIEDLPPEVFDSLVPQMPLDAPQDEKARLLAALDHAKGNRTIAARLLGVSRATLYRRLTEFNPTLIQIPSSDRK